MVELSPAIFQTEMPRLLIPALRQISATVMSQLALLQNELLGVA
jgi:hypothetical protein